MLHKTSFSKKKKGKKGLQLPGIVQQCLSNGMFRIKLENGFQVLAHISGRIRRNSVRILLGDIVTVELSLYDLSRGRIIYRLNRNKKQEDQKKSKSNRHRHRHRHRRKF